MAGIVNDSLIGAIGGVGQGISRGIDDVARINAMKEQQELLPLRKGLVQSELEKSQLENKKILSEQQALDSPSNIRSDPRFLEIYGDATPEEREHMDKAIPVGASNRNVKNYFDTLKQNTEGLQVFSGIGQRKYDKAITDLAGQKKALEQKILSSQTTSTSNMGFQIENPELKQYQQQYQDVTKKFQDAVAAKGKLVANSDKAINSSMIGDIKMKYQDIFKQVPMLSVMADMAEEKGDSAQLEKLMDIVAKAKTPQVANYVEYAMAQSKKPDGTFDWDKSNKILKALISTPKMTVHVGGSGAKESNEDKIVKDFQDYQKKYYGKEIASGKMRLSTRGEILQNFAGEKAGEIAANKEPYQKHSILDDIKNNDETTIDMSGGVSIDTSQFVPK